MQEDKDVLKKVQRRATRTIRDFIILTHEERLDKRGLTKLDKRRRRGDLIDTYKLMTNKEVIGLPFLRFFQLANRSGLRGRIQNLQEIGRRHEAKIFQQQAGPDYPLCYLCHSIWGPSVGGPATGFLIFSLKR